MAAFSGFNLRRPGRASGLLRGVQSDHGDGTVSRRGRKQDQHCAATCHAHGGDPSQRHQSSMRGNETSCLDPIRGQLTGRDDDSEI